MAEILKRGIDVSKHNGAVDWPKVKASGIDYAIIRSSLGWGLSTSKDPRMEANVKGCEDNGIPYGFYHYSYALSVSEAVQEAKYFLDVIQNILCILIKSTIHLLENGQGEVPPIAYRYL